MDVPMDRRAKTVLLVTDRKFWHASGGEKARIASLYRYLVAEGFDVPVFFVGDLGARDRETTQADLTGVQLYLSGDVASPRFRTAEPRGHIGRRLQHAKRRIGSALRGARRRAERGAGCLGDVRALLLARAKIEAPTARERTLESFVSERELRRFQAVCAELKPDFVLVQYVNLAYLVRESRDVLPATTRTLIDTHDIAHERARAFRAFGEPHWIDISREEEIAALAAFDVVIAIQTADAATLQQMLPEQKVITVGHVAELSRQALRSASPAILTFVGSNVEPNQHAIADFMDTVWPMLRGQLGDAVCLRVVGNVCAMLDLVALPKGVELLGQVDDLDSVYRDTDVVVNPVHFGAGLKIKNVEALSAAKPLVTTSNGAAGMADGVDRAFFVCDTPEATFQRLRALIEDPALRGEIGARAYAYASSHFSADAAYAPLRAVLARGC
jgi:glycosyltransferase involved in cell wall biosynthesis